MRLLIPPAALWRTTGLLLGSAGWAWAQVQVLERVDVTATPSPPLLGNAATSSEGDVARERLEARPVYRPGELLETTPGLIVTQHSGEGKANQYFLRGFNLDHGTDLAITVDGMPVNMPTHGHGQGYADVNWLIPELVSGLTYRKGPYFADEGDFSSAGAMHVDVLDRLSNNLAEMSAGSFGYSRGLAASSIPFAGGNVIAAGEIGHYDGPWQRPDDLQKLNGVLRFATGTAEEGFSITVMAYGARWHSTDQIAQRAVTEGLIGRFGTLDPTDGGNVQRYSLSARWATRDGDTQTRANAYAIRSDLALYNDFTYFLRDPVNGDQFKQSDRRTILGGGASRTWYHTLLGTDAESTLGAQTRFDDIEVGLFNTRQRAILSTVRSDDVTELNAGVYGQSTLRWTDWFRSYAGLRGDVFYGHDRSDFAPNSGEASDAIVSPKGGIVFGPIAKAEFYLNAGMGYHSNDVRGATITFDPNDQLTHLRRVPLLARSKGAEVGARTAIADKLEAALSLFVLDFDSELVFSGDAGTTEASRPSRRIGVELTTLWKPVPWLVLDVDAAVTRARFTDSDPAGSYIPGAPKAVLSASANVDELGPWFGGVQLRYFGRRPLIEDDSVTSKPTTLLSARVGYRLTERLALRADIFNLLDSGAHQIDYFYASRLPGEPADGVSDVHFHPVEPRSFRLTLSARF